MKIATLNTNLGELYIVADNEELIETTKEILKEKWRE